MSGSIWPIEYFLARERTKNATRFLREGSLDLNPALAWVDIVWDHWLNGSTDPTMSLVLNGNATYIAVYNQLYPADCQSNSTITPVSDAYYTVEFLKHGTAYASHFHL